MLLNRGRATEVMRKCGIDILVATLAENVFYASDFYDANHFLLRANQVYAVLPQEGVVGSTLVVPQADVDALAEYPTWMERIIPHGFFHFAPPDGYMPEGVDARVQELIETSTEPGPVEALLRALAPLEPEGKTIGLDERGLPIELWDAIRAALPRSKVLPAYATFQQIRMVKTEEEAARLRRANDIVEVALQSTVEAVREGISELELSQVFEHSVISSGARPEFNLISFGEKGGRPNFLPSPEKKLAAGDFIRWDIGCIYKGYHADIGRTYVFGTPSEKQRTYHQASRLAMEEAISYVRPGAIPRDLLERAVRAAREAGIPHFQRSHVGHCIGVELYDPPVLRSHETTPIEEGMVLNIEAPYYEIGFGAIIVEDTMRVTRSGVEIYTKSDRSLVQI